MKKGLESNYVAQLTIGLILITTTLFQCSSENEDVRRILTDRCSKDLINGLKSPTSYKAGSFRFVSSVGEKEYPGIIDSLYMNSRFKVVNGDTVFTTRFTVIHMYLAKNLLGAEGKSMVRAEYNSFLKLLSIRDWSERDERNEVENFKKEGINIEGLTWIK